MSNFASILVRLSNGKLMAGTLALASTMVLGSCDQPKLPCAPTNGLFAVKYTLVDGSGACSMLAGDNMTLHPYANVGKGRPDFRHMPVGMRSELIGNLVAQYKGDGAPELSSPDLSSVGTVTSDAPGDDGFCNVGPMNPTKVMLDAVAADPTAMPPTMALPATSLEQDWSDVRIYVTARNNGTQFSGTVKFTQDACSATFKVRGLLPSVDCEEQVTDAMGNAMGTGKPDDTLCSPCADPSKGRAVGSGISPDVDTVCDPVTLHCVPRNDTPSLLPSPIQCM
jgi:hypothetical protein